MDFRLCRTDNITDLDINAASQLLKGVIPLGITTQIGVERNLRIHCVTGALTFDELIGSLKNLYSDPDFDPGMNSLWDLREADVSSFETPDIQNLRNYVGKHWGTEGKSKSAIVVSRDLDFGLSRMYEFYLQSKTSSEVPVFREYDEGLKWVTA